MPGHHAAHHLFVEGDVQEAVIFFKNNLYSFNLR